MTDKLTRLNAFLGDLDAGAIHYSLGHFRDDAVMVQVAIPGERWEIEFLNDGTVEVERFKSSGEIGGDDALTELLERFSDRNSVKRATGKREKKTHRRESGNVPGGSRRTHSKTEHPGS